MNFNVSGIDLHISKGAKVDDDLLLWAWNGSEWVKVRMDLAFFLADFFCSNEDNRAKYEGHWKFSGTGFFLRALKEATVIGWDAASKKLLDQRRRRGVA